MALLSVATLPFYIDVLGSQAYGLVAFFIQLQMMISLLDIGISATVSRHTALFRAGQLQRAEYFATLRSIEFSFVVVALFILVGMLIAPVLAKSWLNLGKFPLDIAQDTIRLIFVVIALRWMQTYYRAIVLGAEQLVWLGWFNIAISTVRIFGVLPYLYITSGNVLDFFYYQIVVNFIELFVFFIRTNKIIGFLPGERYGAIKKNALFEAISSSLIVGLTSLLWAIITQADKFIASGILTIADYTAYSLVINISSVLLLLSGTCIYAIGPTMARLFSQGKTAEAVEIFRNTSLLVSLMLGSASVVVIGWSEELLFAWTGNNQLAKKASEFLPLYMLGTLFFALGNLSYAINYAVGSFKLRFKYSLVFLVVYLPSLSLSLHQFGEQGLVYGWFVVNFLFFMIPQFLLYRQLDNTLYKKSVIEDIAVPLVSSMSILFLAYVVEIRQFERFEIFGALAIIGTLSLTAGVLFSRGRILVWPYIQRLVPRDPMK